MLEKEWRYMQWLETKNGEACFNDGGQLIAKMQPEEDKYRLWGYNKWGVLVSNTLHTSDASAKGWVSSNCADLAKQVLKWRG